MFGKHYSGVQNWKTILGLGSERLKGQLNEVRKGRPSFVQYDVALSYLYIIGNIVIVNKKKQLLPTFKSYDAKYRPIDIIYFNAFILNVTNKNIETTVDLF